MNWLRQLFRPEKGERKSSVRLLQGIYIDPYRKVGQKRLRRRDLYDGMKNMKQTKI